jgi:glutamine synthetase
MDATERSARRAHAEGLLPGLRERGVVAVATSFVDNSGVSRVKSVPLPRLPALAAWGAGFSPAFDWFRFDDLVVAPESGEGPVGDLRILPDLDRLTVLAAQPGWAWAPGDRLRLDGTPHDQCSRQLVRRVESELADRGFEVRAAFEIEWVVSVGDGDELVPASRAPAYGLDRLVEGSDYCRDVLTALADQGVEVLQLHPEYAAGQLEVSVAAERPVGAADTAVLVRQTIRAVGRAHGLRTSFSPKVDADGVGNGGHVHLSLWRGDADLMAGGEGPYGLTADGEAFAAGIFHRLPALLALGAPSAASYLRLVPQHWAGVFHCWGLENREAPLRMVTGSDGSASWAANIEVKCLDLTANPYLVLTGLLLAGAAGVAAHAGLPEPVEVDPAALGEEARAGRGIVRLPRSLEESLAAFLADGVLTDGLGPALVRSLTAVRRSEAERFEGTTPEETAAAQRWTH